MVRKRAVCRRCAAHCSCMCMTAASARDHAHHTHHQSSPHPNQTVTDSRKGCCCCVQTPLHQTHWWHTAHACLVSKMQRAIHQARRMCCPQHSTAPTSPPRRTRPSRCLTTRLPHQAACCSPAVHTCSVCPAAHPQRLVSSHRRPTSTRAPPQPPQFPAAPASFRPPSDLGAKESKHGNNAMGRNETQNCDPAPATVQAGLRNSCALLGGAAAAAGPAATWLPAPLPCGTHQAAVL